MAWEQRRNGRVYFYSVRRDATGQVVKQYLGRGPRAIAAAAALAQRRARAEADRQAVRDEIARLEPVDRLTRELDDRARLLSEACLLARGFRRYKSGTWGKRREQGP
jgi:hypothetical protein